MISRNGRIAPKVALAVVCNKGNERGHPLLAQAPNYLSSMGTQEVFNSVSGFFRQHQMDFAVIGAFALYGYGYVRATRDIDFLTDIKNQKAITAHLEGLGFNTTHCSTAFSNHVHPVGSTRVDIMYVEGETASKMLGSVQKRLVFEGQEVPVVSPEHLIALKLFAAKNNPDRRLKDLGDVREIVVRTDLPRAVLKNLFQKYEMLAYFADTVGGEANDA